MELEAVMDYYKEVDNTYLNGARSKMDYYKEVDNTYLNGARSRNGLL